MKAHGFSMAGPLLNKKLSELPQWTSNDEGREIYVESKGKRYYGSGSLWVEYIGSITIPGFVNRSKFIWKDADEIYINPGVYHHQGTTEQLVCWDNQLNYQFTNLANSDWSYLYLDSTAIVTADTHLLTANELTDSITEPIWDNTKYGYYNGNDRCIFGVLTDGSGNILEFFHNGSYVSYANQITDLGDTDIDTTWTDVALSAPKFATEIVVIFCSKSAGAGATYSYWRTNGQTGTTGKLYLKVVLEGTFTNTNTVNVISDDSQIIEIKNSASNATELAVYTYGWCFPEGM